MVITAVHLDGSGKPLRYKVENSWGDGPGEKGWFVMTDAWFDQFVYQVVVPKGLAPKELVKVYEGEERVVLPLWDPMVRPSISVVLEVLDTEGQLYVGRAGIMLDARRFCLGLLGVRKGVCMINGTQLLGQRLSVCEVGYNAVCGIFYLLRRCVRLAECAYREQTFPAKERRD